MDVWTLGEKYKAQAKEIEQLEARIKHLEDYLKVLTEGNKAKNEKVQDKKSKSSGVRARRQVTAKS
tara:strand:+ start:452 stop:649 length:198 start_codon:yes stop_codon:yes gene_type:complete